MQFKVKVVGVEQAQKRLEAQAEKIDPGVRGALNTTATHTRAEMYVKPMATALTGKKTRSRMVIKRANSRWIQSRIIPSSSGVEVLEYRRWGYDPIEKTRGRIWVRGPSGRKVAAGFVNPSGRKKKPLITKSEKARNLKRPPKFDQRKSYLYKKPLQDALGPSVAYWFKQLTTLRTINWVNAYLQQEFNKRLQKELLK